VRVVQVIEMWQFLNWNGVVCDDVTAKKKNSKTLTNLANYSSLLNFFMVKILDDDKKIERNPKNTINTLHCHTFSWTHKRILTRQEAKDELVFHAKKHSAVIL
jgi:hypothetical protein